MAPQVVGVLDVCCKRNRTLLRSVPPPFVCAHRQCCQSCPVQIDVRTSMNAVLDWECLAWTYATRTIVSARFGRKLLFVSEAFISLSSGWIRDGDDASS